MLLTGTSRKAIAGAIATVIAAPEARAESIAILPEVRCPGALTGSATPRLAVPALTVGIDGGVGTRSLRYRDDLFGTLRPYSLSAAPVVGGEIAVYPGAFFTCGRPAWIGITARAEGFVGLDTQRVQHDASLPTRAWSAEGALRLRAPWSRGAVWIDGGFAARAFTIGKVGITDPDLPSVTYLGPRLAVGGELGLPLGLSVAPRGALARWVSLGDLGSPAWFPHARMWGVELGLRVGWSAPRGFSPYFDAVWTREVGALRPQPGEVRVAGGLADDRFAARLGLAWAFAPAHRD